jgi:hypothetical protein
MLFIKKKFAMYIPPPPINLYMLTLIWMEDRDCKLISKLGC